jgi:hypothetical protein
MQQLLWPWFEQFVWGKNNSRFVSAPIVFPQQQLQ